MNGDEFLDFYTDPVEHIRLKGTRIGFELVINLFNAGKRPEEIAAEGFGYPLPLSQVYGAIAYYLEHRREMDNYVRLGEEDFERELKEHYSREAPDVVKRMVAIKERREALCRP